MQLLIMHVEIKVYSYKYNNGLIVKYLFYSLLIILFIITALNHDKKIRKDQLCKEGLFFQMLFKKCTPRDSIYEETVKEKYKIVKSNNFILFFII